MSLKEKELNEIADDEFIVEQVNSILELINEINERLDGRIMYSPKASIEMLKGKTKREVVEHASSIKQGLRYEYV